MLIRWLPLITGVVPFLSIILSYVIGVRFGYLPSCNPFFDGCTSISATGRYPPASFVFRAVQLPSSMLLYLVWYYAVLWLRVLQPELRNSRVKSILIAGAVGASALIIYVTFLGTKEPIYEFMRRFGIYFYFLGTSLAQLLVALSFYQVGKSSYGGRMKKLAGTMLVLCLMPFGLGILNLALKAVLRDADAPENSIEWIAVFFMQAYFVALYIAWRNTDFAASVSVRDVTGSR